MHWCQRWLFGKSDLIRENLIIVVGWHGQEHKRARQLRRTQLITCLRVRVVRIVAKEPTARILVQVHLLILHRDAVVNVAHLISDSRLIRCKAPFAVDDEFVLISAWKSQVIQILQS